MENDEFELGLDELGEIESPVSGLTEEEEKDPNRIQVAITDPAPVIILFGARTSGKTMTLIRLTRYLRQNGFKVEPDRIFRPSSSTHYQRMCDEFDATIGGNDIANEGTSTISFMLVKVMNANGEPICQILEAPGEHYFDADYPDRPFPNYINEICSINNLKTWVFIVEKDWKDSGTRNKYAQKIIKLNSIIDSKDKIIFTCHKVDKHPALFNNGQPNVKQFFKEIKNQYPGIFENYQNLNPITRFFRTYRFDFVPFSAGIFNQTNDGGQTFNQGKDRYPASLWAAIQKSVRGGWF
jgi:hypothetical protein